MSMPESPPDPRMVTNTQIANDVMAHVNSDATDDTPIWDKHWSRDCVSVEADGSEHAGREAMEKKYEWFFNAFTVHDCKAEGPFVSPDGFSIIFEVDMEPKDGSFPRMTSKEVAVYTVTDGKVTRETFMCAPQEGC